jgi:hypothetical protein
MNELTFNGKNIYVCSKVEIDQAYLIIKDALTSLDKKSTWSFHPGDIVTFFARGQQRTGTVRKIHMTTVSVDENNTHWKVSGSLLKRIGNE